MPLPGQPPANLPPPNYNEALAKAVPGTPYRRVRYIGIANTKPQQPTAPQVPRVQLIEEDMVYLADGTTSPVQGGYAQTIDIPITDAEMARAFGLLNPADDTVIPGEGTGGQIFLLLYSWARSHQKARDLYQPPKQAYAFDAEGKFTSAQWVACNEEGTFTLPASTTFTPPPTTMAGQVAKWVEDAWVITSLPT